MQEIVYQEEPDYPFHSFISDIGGATGVILGISFATVFGAIDFAFAHFIGQILNIVKKGENDLENVFVFQRGFQISGRFCSEPHSQKF